MILRVFLSYLKHVKGENINVSKISRRLIIILSLIVLMTPVNGYIIYQQHQSVQNDALAINNFGFLRGSIQRYEKLRLYKESKGRSKVIDDLFNNLEEQFIIPNIENEYLVSKNFFEDFQLLRSSWNRLKSLKNNRLEASELCWKISNRLTYTVQEFSEKKEQDLLKMIFSMIIVETLFILIVIYVVLKSVRGELEQSAVIDPLTKLYNRRFLLEQLEYLGASYKRHKKPFSALLIDADHFKLVNDELGHQAGDEVLKKIGGLLKQLLRTSDMAFRYGGEEFVVIAPETDGENAMILAERFREMICDGYIIHNRKVTVSIGVAEFVKNESVVQMLKRSDDALYQAKEDGRNCVKLSPKVVS